MALPPRTRTRAQATTPATPEPQDAPPPRIRRQAPAAPVRGQSPTLPRVSAAVATTSIEVHHRQNRETVSHTNETEHTPYRLPDDVVHPAYVRVEGKATVQPAPYESVGIGISLSLPCAPDMASIEAAFAQAQEWVGNKVAEQVDVARGR